MFFAYWELRLKRQLTDDPLAPVERAIDFGITDELSDRLRRERILRELPKQALFKFRLAVALKFLFLAILIAEVIVLQR